jgi:Mg-chelatase subunit ChlD
MSDKPIPTLINVILDESGSMGIKRSDVIHGFNTFLKEQQAQPGECRMSVVKFNTEYTVIHSAVPISAIAELTEKTYVPGGNTALLDAVAETVRLADKDKRTDERVLCLIITDGEENSSRETTKEQVQQIIKERESRGDWTFTYLGISPEKWHERGLTTAAMNNMAYNTQAPHLSFAAASVATSSYRACSARQVKDFYADHTPPSPKMPDSPWERPHK